MDDRLYQFLKVTAITMTLLWVGWAAYDSFFRNRAPSEHAYHAANKLFGKAELNELLEDLNEVLV